MIEGHTKKLPRRRLLQLAAGAVALPAVSRIAHAQAYPTKPVRLIVGFAAGGTFDTLARPMAQWLSERYRRQFVIENRLAAAALSAQRRPSAHPQTAIRSSWSGRTTVRLTEHAAARRQPCRGARSAG